MKDHLAPGTSGPPQPHPVTPPRDLVARHTLPADVVAAFLLERAVALRGAVAFQGQWNPVLPDPGVSPLVRQLTVSRLWKVDLHATRSLLAWSAGQRRVHLLLHVPTAMELLAHQAAGWRCICLVDDAQTPAVHQNPYLFVVHDLCHLEKFADPQHHHAQVGFFFAVHHALNHPQWRNLEAQTLDSAWLLARDAVVSDMNGSVIFLMAALKMKLKMAARRVLAAQRGVVPSQAGPLSPAELAVYQDLEAVLLSLMELPGDIQHAAQTISKRRDTPQDAIRFHEHFDSVGRAVNGEAP